MILKLCFSQNGSGVHADARGQSRLPGTPVVDYFRLPWRSEGWKELFLTLLCNKNIQDIWQADQADKNMFGRTNNILAGYLNKAVLALPDIPMLEGCRKAALDRQVAVSILFRFVAHFP